MSVPVIIHRQVTIPHLHRGVWRIFILSLRFGGSWPRCFAGEMLSVRGRCGGDGLICRRRLVCVISVVSPQVTSDHVTTTGAVRAWGTLVRLLAWHWDSQTRPCYRCVTCVCPLVCGEMVRPGEHLATHAAAVWLVAGVEPHVAAEHVTPGKCSLAHLAQIRLRVRVCTVSGAGLKLQLELIQFVILMLSPCVCWPCAWRVCRGGWIPGHTADTATGPRLDSGCPGWLPECHGHQVRRHAISSCYLSPGLGGQRPVAVAGRGDQGVRAARTWGEQELGGDWAWGGGRGGQREGHGVRGRARAHGGAHGEVHRKLLLLHWGLVRLNRAGLGISEGIIVTSS